jgi:hypothetical protein
MTEKQTILKNIQYRMFNIQFSNKDIPILENFTLIVGYWIFALGGCCDF